MFEPTPPADGLTSLIRDFGPLSLLKSRTFNFSKTDFSEETSGANVYIDKEYNGSDSNAMCVIQGKLEQVSIAKVMIQEKLNQYNSANTFPIQHDNEGWIFFLKFLTLKYESCFMTRSMRL